MSENIIFFSLFSFPLCNQSFIHTLTHLRPVATRAMHIYCSVSAGFIDEGIFGFTLRKKKKLYICKSFCFEASDMQLTTFSLFLSSFFYFLCFCFYFFFFLFFRIISFFFSWLLGENKSKETD